MSRLRYRFLISCSSHKSCTFTTTLPFALWLRIRSYACQDLSTKRKRDADYSYLQTVFHVINMINYYFQFLILGQLDKILQPLLSWIRLLKSELSWRAA